MASTSSLANGFRVEGVDATFLLGKRRARTKLSLDRRHKRLAAWI
jgi:hypothetical protein